MGKIKSAQHYCRICGRRRAMRSLVGVVNALHICKDCQRELKREEGETRCHLARAKERLHGYG